MKRPTIVLVILLALLWQTVWAATASLSVHSVADLEHAALHWHGESHHHHDDGSFHVDDSQESAQHLAADHLSASPAVVSQVSLGFPPAGSAAPNAVHGPPAPSPPADGLLRPPRLRS